VSIEAHQFWRIAPTGVTNKLVSRPGLLDEYYYHYPYPASPNAFGFITSKPSDWLSGWVTIPGFKPALYFPYAHHKGWIISCLHAQRIFDMSY
jgi:hypothetical protein